MSKLLNRKENTVRPVISKGQMIDRDFFIGSMVILGILLVALVFAGINMPAPEAKYSGNVTVTSKTVKGYACSVHYIQEDGKEDGKWLGKPGKAICDPINMGPARMVDGSFVKGSLTD
jgi:hypothetical protein